MGEGQGVVALLGSIEGFRLPKLPEPYAEIRELVEEKGYTAIGERDIVAERCADDYNLDSGERWDARDEIDFNTRKWAFYAESIDEADYVITVFDGCQHTDNGFIFGYAAMADTHLLLYQPEDNNGEERTAQAEAVLDGRDGRIVRGLEELRTVLE